MVDEIKKDLAEEREDRRRLEGKWDAFDERMDARLEKFESVRSELDSKVNEIRTESIWASRFVKFGLSVIAIILTIIGVMVAIGFFGTGAGG